MMMTLDTPDIRAVIARITLPNKDTGVEGVDPVADLPDKAILQQDVGCCSMRARSELAVNWRTATLCISWIDLVFAWLLSESTLPGIYQSRRITLMMFSCYTSQYDTYRGDVSKLAWG